MPPMNLDYLSWEAFATLVTGGLAVGAAIFVGLRQVGIAKRQADIQGKQADISSELAKIEKLKIRADLHDRRLAVFAAVDDWLRYTVQGGEPPALSGDEGIEVRRRFESARITSRFLFRPIVRETIEHYWKLGNDLHYVNACMKIPTEVPSAATERTKIIGRLGRALTNFQDIVGPEMDLGQVVEDAHSE